MEIEPADTNTYSDSISNTRTHTHTHTQPTPTPSPSPTPAGNITLVSRLSDARAFARNRANGKDIPPPQIQTDFLPANLSNGAKISGESGIAVGSSTSHSSIVVDNDGTLHIVGDGGASARAFLMDASASGAAKIIVIGFTLEDGNYSYSLRGQLSAQQFDGGGSSTSAATAKLTGAHGTVFDVVADHPPAVTLSQSSVLQPGDYTLSIEVNAAAEGADIGGEGQAICSANFDFALRTAPTPTPTLPPTPTPTPTPTPCLSCTPAPTPTPTATPTLTSTPTATPSVTASPAPAQALNLSTRLLVQTGSNVGIAGFIITGGASKQILVTRRWTLAF